MLCVIVIDHMDHITCPLKYTVSEVTCWLLFSKNVATNERVANELLCCELKRLKFLILIRETFLLSNSANQEQGVCFNQLQDIG